MNTSSRLSFSSSVKSKCKWWKRINTQQKFNFFFTSLAILILPVAVFAALRQTYFESGAAGDVSGVTSFDDLGISTMRNGVAFVGTEAEAGYRGTQKQRKVNSIQVATKGRSKYIRATKKNRGWIIYTFSVPVSGEYRFKASVCGNTGGSDSFKVRFFDLRKNATKTKTWNFGKQNKHNCNRLGKREIKWNVVTINPLGTQKLTAGEKYKLIIYGREVGAMMDKWWLVQQNPDNVSLVSVCKLGLVFQEGGAIPTQTFMSSLASNARDLNVCSNYQSIYWYKVEKSPGVFTWSASDDYLDAQIANGVRPVGRLWFTPEFYSSMPSGSRAGNERYILRYAPKVQYLDKWSRFVRLAVDRYKDKVDDWLLYHEPHHGLSFQTPGNYKHPIKGDETGGWMQYKNFDDALYYFYLTQRYGSAVVRDVDKTKNLYLTVSSDFLTDGDNKAFWMNYFKRPGARNTFDIVRLVAYFYYAYSDYFSGVNFDLTKVSSKDIQNALSAMGEEVKAKVDNIDNFLRNEYGVNKLIYGETGVNSDFNNDHTVSKEESKFQKDALNKLIPAYLDSKVDKLFIYRMMNSDPKSSTITKGQLQWRTLGVFKLNKSTVSGNVVYTIGEPKPSADVIKNMAQTYNRSARSKPSIAGEGEYTLVNGPCYKIPLARCIFDAREIYNDNGTEYEFIAKEGNFYYRNYKKQKWVKMSIKDFLKPFNPPTSFCNVSNVDLPCVIDSISIKRANGGVNFSFTWGNKRLSVRRSSLFGTVLNVSHITMETDHYSVLNNSPCKNKSSRNCFLNTRTFKSTDVGTVEVVTRGRTYYTYNLGTKKWSDSHLMSEKSKFSTDVNAPCYQRNFCVFDSHTYYENTNGNFIEEVTLGTTLYTYDDNTSTWHKSQLVGASRPPASPF